MNEKRRSNKCVFLDRDGVINKDNPAYTYKVESFQILPGVIDALKDLKAAGFLLIVVTNQSGIDKGIYTLADMHACHAYLQMQCGHSIDHIYFSPYHPTVTESLSRKPGTLMFERAIARYQISPEVSWMVGDRGRDIIPARQLNMRTIQIGDEVEPENQADFQVESLWAASRTILETT